MENKRIRRLIFDNDLKHKQVAAELGICQETFSRKLAKKLSKDEEAKIIEVINTLKRYSA